MTRDKEKYLADEARHLELSKDGGLCEVDINYMTGYRDGVKTGYNEAVRILKEIKNASSVTELVNWNLKNIDELSSQYSIANCRISEITTLLELSKNSKDEEIVKNREILKEYLDQWQELSDRLEDEKEEMINLENRVLSLDFKEDFVYLPYETNIESEKITVDEALEILSKTEPTDELIDTYIRDYKNMLGIYLDLGEEEDERISNKIYEYIDKERIKGIHFIQDELKEIYRNRENTSESQAVEV